MKKILLSSTLLLVTITSLLSQKMILHKKESLSKPQKHPYTSLLSKGDQQPIKLSKSNPNYNKLLVILVDFQEEINPNTTGNGKFILEPDPAWKTTIGSPPHNREYFEANLEAMRYYYKAVSMEHFDLEYDVYPKDKPAYTLPHPIGYYNPPSANSYTFVQKMEEYFKVAFETADADDPEIDFSQYGHFMIIHAGSDWQHDVKGDSPSDIPSFFIRVGAGSEAVVNGGSVRISSAANVPSTISQDFDTFTEDGQLYHTGYGAINAVMAHEFGHSLGLVDLYNVQSFQPMVGVFDIMDSGGGGILIDRNEDEGYSTFVEGVLPTLPGAYSRSLLFEDFYRDHNYMKDISELNLYKNVNLRASSARQNPLSPALSIVKIPLNKYEYILIENRSVDPDGDGFTSVSGALNGRVVLYPTRYSDPTDSPTYEYDYLLPSFIAQNGDSVGGGVLVWHIDDDIIHNQGRVASDGNFYSNFVNNSVNTNYYNRGVKIIEADALPDIGYAYSYYWTGTAYEYFHKRKPILDANGLFVNWSQTPWKDKLSAGTSPALVDNKGVAGMYGLEILGNPAATMNIRFFSAFFEQSQFVGSDLLSPFAAPIIKTSFNSPISDLPILTQNSLNLFTHQASASGNSWEDYFGSFDLNLNQPQFPVIISDTNANGFSELILATDSSIKSIEIADDAVIVNNTEFNANIVTTPLFLSGSLWVATANDLHRFRNATEDFITIDGIKKLSGYGNSLIVLQERKYKLYDTDSVTLISELELPELFGAYEPLVYHDIDRNEHQIFLMSNAGNLYRSDMNGIHLIFTNPDKNLRPTNISMTRLGEYSPVLFFGVGTKVYAMRYDGTLISGFPKTFSAYTFDQYAHPKAIVIDSQDTMFIPANSNVYVGISAEGRLIPSRMVNREDIAKQDILHWESGAQMLYWIMPTFGNAIRILGSHTEAENPIMWSGFRNGNSGVFDLPANQAQTPNIPGFEAFIYPNPVTSSNMRIRLIDSKWDSKVTIFDISGNRIYEQNIQYNGMDIRDIQVSAAKFSSGVYFAIIESNGIRKSLKFAIEK